MWGQLIDFLVMHGWARNIVMTLVLLLSTLLLRWMLGRSLRRAHIRSIELRRRWMIQIRNLCFALFVLGMIAIWATELRAFAFSIVAVLVAIVLATKELILCLTGSLFKITAGAFSVGDRIEVNGIRGEVIDQTLLATRVMETGPGDTTQQSTGRSVTIPNSLFLSSPVFNENLVKDYVIHVMHFPLKASEDCARLAADLEKIAGDISSEYIDHARKRIGRLVEVEGLDTPSIEPRVSLEFPDPDRVNLLLRVPMRSEKKGLTEREIRYRFLAIRGIVQEGSD